MSKLAAVKVFEIPELATLVINHLKKRDLVACALVHSAWHKATIPFIYHSITIVSVWRFRERSLDEDFWSGFKKYGRYMRLLEIDSSAVSAMSSLGFSCINLTDLHLDICEEASTNVLWFRGLLKLISNNPGISSLELGARSGCPVTFDHHLVVLGLLRYMPQLKKLLITGTYIGQSAVDEIMRCAHRLEELSLDISQISKDPIPRPCQQRTGFILGLSLTDLSLKDHDNDDNTHDEPYILDSQGRRCRLGTSLKKFSLTLGNDDRYALSDDAFLLAFHCYSVEDIQLFVKEGTTRRKIMRALEDQVDHPAWCLKHLKIGHILHRDTSILVKLLSVRSTSLVSLWLASCCFSDEIISALLQNHGKTLQRMTMSSCEVRYKPDIEALLSGCSDLRSLDVFNSGGQDYFAMGLPKECQLQWTGRNGRVFEVFMSENAYWTIHGQVYSTMEEDETMEEEGSIPDDPWRQVQLMKRDGIRSHVRFLAK
ncbi:hypothetical protein BGZ75_006188 [Mortierella antarctica]|nr:hypothetical protein BGZ75_006188 [Mortierella antarctica]